MPIVAKAPNLLLESLYQKINPKGTGGCARPSAGKRITIEKYWIASVGLDIAYPSRIRRPVQA